MKITSNIMAVPLNFEELLFSNKNREYGAFLLRKSYITNLFIACIAAILIFSAVTFSQLVFRNSMNTGNKTGGNSTSITLASPPSIEGQKDVRIIQVPPSAIKTIKYTVPKIVDDDKVIENIPTIEDLLNVQPWTKTQESETGGIDPTLNFIEPKTSTEPEAIKTIYTWVEVMPHYPGGQESLFEFITSRVVYPEIAKRAGIQGKVITSFTIERDGSISNIKIEKGIGAGCDEEAKRVISMLDKWDPGRQNGNPVRVRMIIPINFKLQ